jgi:dipeptidyl aminopeptidase/acylaminoacyl peptidase
MVAFAVKGLLKPRLHYVPSAGVKPEFLEGVPFRAGNIRVNPDPEQKYLVYRLDQGGDENWQLYRYDLTDGRVVLLTKRGTRNSAGRFNPDGSRLVFVSNRRNGVDQELWMLDPRRPVETIQQIQQGEGTWYPSTWSPSGDRLVVARYMSINESELYVLDVETGELWNPFPDRGEDKVSYGGAVWSSDGRRLYYVSDAGSEFLRLRELDLETGDERLVTETLDWDVVGVEEISGMEALLLSVNEDAYNRLYVYHIDSDRLEELDVFPTGLVVGADPHPSRPLLAVSHQDPRGVVDSYAYDLETRQLVRWTNADAEPRPALPPAELVHFPTFDEVDGLPREISAFVLRGSDLGGPTPVLIDIHGGPESQAGPSAAGADLIRTKGVTVIKPNVRGSSGYGKTFLTLDNGYLREDAVKDIGSLLDWIETQPALDAGRVAVTGGSYGGYMVLASLIHFGDRLRCGVDRVGISNFVTFLENTADYRRDLRRAEYGDERDPDMREFLESISPSNRADEIRVPLLVFGGANDPRVPVSESRQIVRAVRDTGAEVWYMEAANEGHGASHPWNIGYLASAATAFLEQCLLQ